MSTDDQACALWLKRRTALTMSPDEKRARMLSPRRHVSEHDIHAWTRKVIGAARGSGT